MGSVRARPSSRATWSQEAERLAAILVHSFAISVCENNGGDGPTDQTALPHQAGLVPGLVRELIFYAMSW